MHLFVLASLLGLVALVVSHPIRPTLCTCLFGKVDTKGPAQQSMLRFELTVGWLRMLRCGNEAKY